MKLLREPLVHFLILGAAIFAAFSFMTRHKTDKPREIVISQGTLENIVTGFSRTWQRPPTEDELRGLVRDYIREEAAYREALLELEADGKIEVLGKDGENVISVGARPKRRSKPTLAKDYYVRLKN